MKTSVSSTSVRRSDSEESPLHVRMDLLDPERAGADSHDETVMTVDSLTASSGMSDYRLWLLYQEI